MHTRSRCCPGGRSRCGRRDLGEAGREGDSSAATPHCAPASSPSPPWGDCPCPAEQTREFAHQCCSSVGALR